MGYTFGDMTPLTALLDPFLTLLYPPRCLVCRMLGEAALCEACAGQIIPIASPACRICGHTMTSENGCQNCLTRRPAFQIARALGAYEGVLQIAIHHFKYRDRPQLALPLGRYLAEYAREHAAELNDLRFDGLVPVPMHPIRQRLRGYNQSDRLARVLSEELELPLLTSSLVRIRPTRAQVGLAREARYHNLSGAFQVRFHETVAGKALLLIDDVATTGSSLHECAAALKAANAKAVYALTLAAG